MAGLVYEEIGSVQISEKRNIVISQCSAGGFTLAQQMKIEDGNIKVNMFLKNAIRLDSLQNLKDLRDCISKAIENVEKC